jgi:hypothetical protein
MPARDKRQRGQPQKVLHLTTYARLEEYLRAFAQGHFHLLILVGSGGLAKSRSVRAVLGGKGHRLALRRAEPGAAGHPAGVHHQEPGHHHRDRPQSQPLWRSR